MTIGRPCAVCSLGFDVRQEADRRLRDGTPVKKVHEWLVAEHRVTFAMRNTYNHNQRHTRMVSRAVAALTDTQKAARHEVEVAKSVVNDPEFDPLAFLAPASIARDIRKTSDRLEVAADDAASSKQHSALANLSSALLRSHELRGKLGGTIVDGTAVAIQVNVADLGRRVLGALDDDPERRRLVAASLMQPVRSSAVDIGIAPATVPLVGTVPEPERGGVDKAPGPEPDGRKSNVAASAPQQVGAPAIDQERAWAVLSAAGITAAEVESPTPEGVARMEAILRGAGVIA